MPMLFLDMNKSTCVESKLDYKFQTGANLRGT